MSTIKQQSRTKKDSSLLLSHNALQDTATLSGNFKQDKSLEELYNTSNTRLLRIEEELDVLLHCAHLLREQRTEKTIGRLEYSEDPTRTATLHESDQLIDDYLALAAKSKAVDNIITLLNQECAAARSECNYILTKIRKSSPAAPSARLHQALKINGSLAHGSPESGFADREALAERIMTAESTGTSVAGVVGAFGAGITYTTLHSTTRGRLDVMSWAFTCFLMVVIDSAAIQLFALPRHGQLAKLFRMEYTGSAESRLLSYVLLVGIPMISGFLLLGLSVALLDTNSSKPIPGSHIAIRAAGYLPVASLGYFMIVAVTAALGAAVVCLLPRRLLPSRKYLPAEAQKYYSIIPPLQEKLYFLPGGAGYALYRQRRLCRKDL